MKQPAVKQIAIIICVIAAIILFSSFIRREREDNESGDNSIFDFMSNGIPSQKNFTIAEFNCHDGTKVPEQYYGNVQALMNQLQLLRNYVGKPITVNSGYRTPSYNKSVGGAANSMHLVGKAADIRISGMTPTQVRQTILNLIASGQMQDGGLGAYSSFTHYDIGTPRRWKG